MRQNDFGQQQQQAGQRIAGKALIITGIFLDLDFGFLQIADLFINVFPDCSCP